MPVTFYERRNPSICPIVIVTPSGETFVVYVLCTVDLDMFEDASAAWQTQRFVRTSLRSIEKRFVPQLTYRTATNLDSQGSLVLNDQLSAKYRAHPTQN